ncbi:hypothetical protein PCASD_24990 [Puccinia coronata f. sp. avenae]|uniref:Uncharacterized protein n=1 Tax=Puccinia coronata f. sp. avenae TaxID=200324 RepID=A0A2N5TJ13_9BASI|nr:hypothetical protein PCASD_24990 [Puccinia coronata f. sp. avenae]
MLGQIGLKITALERTVNQSRAAVRQQAAKNYLVWEITRGLGLQSSLEHPAGAEANLDRLSRLPHPSALESKPAQLRVAISSLLNLSVHLVSADIRKASVIQNQIQDFVNAAIDMQKSQMSKSPDAKLHLQWLKSRVALSSVYLSEIAQAVHQASDQSIVDRTQNALDMIDSTLSTF